MTDHSELPLTAPAGHLLALPRGPSLIPLPGTIDVSTTSAHDFDVDGMTGFMPPLPPLSRLPELFHAWEELLADAISRNLKASDMATHTEKDAANSVEWRYSVEQVRRWRIRCLC